MKQLLTFWSFDATSVGTVVLLAVIYFAMARRNLSRIGYFIAALILAILCFFSPLHVLSAQYLFSAHMAVHVILLLCIGPLLVLGLTHDNRQFAAFFTFSKAHVVLGWLTGVGIMWLWHVPIVFNKMMTATHNHTFNFLPIIETLSLVLAGVLFSAPVLHPNKEFRIDPLAGVVYLFTACIGCSVLGLLITFAPAGTYHHYLAMHDVYGLNTVIQQQWGITQEADQQAAGLIMWVPCCLLYVSGALYLLMQWFGQKDEISIQVTKT